MRFLSDDASAPADPTKSSSSPTSIRIIGAGLSRCATSSLQAAFESPTLDCAPSLHMSRIVPHADRLKAIAAAMSMRTQALGATNGGGLGNSDPHRDERQKIVRDLCHGYGAVCDTPGLVFADDLMDIYPESIIVLNGRKGGGVAWRKSMDDTIAFLSTKRYAISCFLWTTDRWMYRCARLIRTTSQERHGGVSIDDPATYNLHAEWVRREAAKRGRKVIEWLPEDGWAPLCEALGKEVPRGKPFPHVNDTKDLQFILKVVVVRGLVSWALLGTGIWAGWRYGLPWLRGVVFSS